MYYIDERFNTKQRHQELNCKLYELNCQLYELNCQLHELNCQLHELNCQLHELNCQLYELNCQLYEHTPAVSLPSQPQFGYLPLYIVSAVGLRQYTIS